MLKCVEGEPIVQFVNICVLSSRLVIDLILGYVIKKKKNLY